MAWSDEKLTVAQKDYVSDLYFDVVAGKKLTVKSHETKELEETVPAGKKWTVHVKVEVNERDA
jgi:hypothetical protein